MRDKIRDKKMRKRRIQHENPDLSLSSDSELDKHDNYVQESNELAKELKEQEAKYQDEDFDFFPEVPQTIKKSKEIKSDTKVSFDTKLIQKLKQELKVIKSIRTDDEISKSFCKCYKLLILFCVYKSEVKKETLSDHPVLKKILECQQLLPKITHISSKLNQESLNTCRDSVVVKNNLKKKMEKTVDDDVNSNPITFEMLKNRGIAKRRSTYKKNLTPKLKQQKRFKMAKHKLRSRGVRFSTDNKGGRYEGESRGIRVNVNKAMDI